MTDKLTETAAEYIVNKVIFLVKFFGSKEESEVVGFFVYNEYIYFQLLGDDGDSTEKEDDDRILHDDNQYIFLVVG